MKPRPPASRSHDAPAADQPASAAREARRAPAPRQRSAAWLLGLAILLYVAYGAAFILNTSFVLGDGQRYFCLFDDAMISLRYGWNLAHGHGLVWNLGERVEGYTNPLLTLLMGAACLPGDRRLAAGLVQALGVATLLLCGCLAARVYAGLRSPSIGGTGWVVAGVLAYYPLIFWSLMGMETGLVTAGLLATLAAAFAAARTATTATLLATSAAAAATYLARPDGLVLTLPALLYVFTVLAARGAGLRAAFALGLPLAGTLLVHTALRFAYYGEFVPNTYTLKVAGVPLSSRLENGLIFLGLLWADGRPSSYLLETGPALAAAGAALLWRCLATRRNAARPIQAAHSPDTAQRTTATQATNQAASTQPDDDPTLHPPHHPRRRALVLGGTIVLALLYQVYVGGDPWSYWRMLTPVFPLMVMLVVAVALEAAGARTTRPPRERRWRTLPAATLLLVMLGAADARFWREWTLTQPAFSVAENRDHVQTALALNRVLRPDATVGLLFAGTVAYYTDFRAVDLLGKCDPRIARLPPDLTGAVAWDGLKTVPGHNKYDLEYSIVERQPDYVDRLRWGAQSVSSRVSYYTTLVADRALFLRSGSPHVDGCALGDIPALPADAPGALRLQATEFRGGRNVVTEKVGSVSAWRAADPAQPASGEFALLTPARGYYQLEVLIRAERPYPLRTRVDQLILGHCPGFPTVPAEPHWQPLGVFFLKRGAIRLVIESDRDFPELHAVRAVPRTFGTGDASPELDDSSR